MPLQTAMIEMKSIGSLRVVVSSVSIFYPLACCNPCCDRASVVASSAASKRVAVDYFESFATAETRLNSAAKGEALHELAKALPMERLLLETDGPYMAPAPYRGQERMGIARGPPALP